MMSYRYGVEKTCFIPGIPLPLWNWTVTVAFTGLGRMPIVARNPHHKPYVLLIVMKIQDCGAQDRTVTEAKSNGTKGLGIE